MAIECLVVKTFEAWDETSRTWVQARMIECGNKNYIVPKGTRPVFDSEGKIIWIVREEGAGR